MEGGGGGVEFWNMVYLRDGTDALMTIAPFFASLVFQLVEAEEGKVFQMSDGRDAKTKRDRNLFCPSLLLVLSTLGKREFVGAGVGAGRVTHGALLS